MSETFDIVIVGAGSAGCVLANRLSRDAGKRVLLLEAGGSDRHPLVALPSGARKVRDLGLFEWGDVSDPDPGLDHRAIPVPHGRILGGSSSLNYMAVIRGEAAAFDRWAAQGATGWSYDEVLPFFRECERWAGEAGEHRGDLGEVGVQEGARFDPLQEAMVDAVATQGYPINADMNGASTEGFGWIQYNIERARRMSSARAFLRPVAKRRNLTIRTGAHATRLRFDGPRATAVEYRCKGRAMVAEARERIVLSAGAINTPHLLLLSGVGPADELKAMGVAPVADLPVGRNLADHIGVTQFWKRTQPGPFHASLRLDRMAASMAAAYLFRRGGSANLPAALLGFAKSAPDKPLLDLEFILAGLAPDADVWFPGVKRPFDDAFYVSTWLLGQQSRGSVTLRSTDPMERPRIVYNSLTDPDDLAALRAGYRLAAAMGTAPELASYRAAPLFPDRELTTDAEIDAFIRATALQLYHPASTCRMGAPGESVLDPELRVRGIDGLNVVDASAMPFLPGGGPNIVCMMMAAKAAAMWTAA